MCNVHVAVSYRLFHCVLRSHHCLRSAISLLNHMCFVDLLDIHVSTKHSWALPLTEVYDVILRTQYCDRNTRRNDVRFYMELPHIFIFTCQRSYLTRGELAMKVGRTVGGGRLRSFDIGCRGVNKATDKWLTDRRSLLVWFPGHLPFSFSFCVYMLECVNYQSEQLCFLHQYLPISNPWLKALLDITAVALFYILGA